MAKSRVTHSAKREARDARYRAEPPAGVNPRRVNFYGQVSEIDSQGRVVIPARLRESATMVGEVDVFGQFNYLEVWNHERFIAKLQREPFTDDDARALSDLGL